MEEGSMRRLVVAAALFAATGAVAQEKYTNADLDRIYVPGAYTNDDLKALPRLEVQPAPAMAPWTPRIDTRERDLMLERVRGLEERRLAVSREMEYEESIIRKVEGPGGNSPDSEYYLGHRSKSRGYRAALRREIALLDQEIEDARWHAVRASIVVLP
jgi:hypothetical protein